MNTVVTLNLSRIRPTGSLLPAYAVADLIPVSEGRGDERQALMGVVLELSNRRKLQAPIKIDPGPVVVNVRFPTGQLLSQQVNVVAQGEQSTISFTVHTKKIQRRSEHQIAETQQSDDTVSNETVSEGRRHGGRGISGESRDDRSRWSVVPVDGFGRGRLALRAALERVAERSVDERQNNYGVARLQSNSQSAAPIFGARRQREFDPSAIVGDVIAVQPIKLYGDISSLHTQWKNPIRSTSRLGPLRDEGMVNRYFALSYRASQQVNTYQVACIPGRWQTSDSSSAQLRVTFRRNLLDASGSLKIHIDVADPEYGAMLQFLQTGDIESSYALFEKGVTGLQRKFSNPYAAAAGAYVLLYSGLRHDAERWGQWIYNLATHFDALPDGMILYATLLLQSPTSSRDWLRGSIPDGTHFYATALDAAMEAVKRGPPLYRLGLVLLTSNLQILGGVFRNDDGTYARIQSASRYVQDLSLRADPAQPFCVFDVSQDAL